MKTVTAIIAALWLCLSFVSPAQAGEKIRGYWTLSPSLEHGKVRFAVTLTNPAGEKSKHATNWPVTAFNMLDLESEGKHAVLFTIDREIGRVKCRGFIEGGEGRGMLTFEVSPQYLELLRSRGEEETDGNLLFAAILRELAAPQS